ncbi:unnamed protein product [Caenorhabditis brenneri]
MSRPFRPYAKIPVNISFKSYDRPKKVVWDRGFIKVVDDGECVELSSFWKDHANLPIERLYRNKIRGSDVRPYIFTIRLDANHPENEGQKLIRLNFNGNREGYQHALNSINNAFETFAYRLRNQAKKRPRPQNDEQVVRNDKKKKNEEKKKQEKSASEKAANFAENLPVKKVLSNSRSGVAIQLLRPPPPKPHSWVSEFDRLLGGPEKVSTPKVNNPYEEIRLAEIRRRNDLKLEQRRKERAEKRKAERPTPEVEVMVVKKKEIVVEAEIRAKQQKNKPIGAENSSVVKQLEDPEKAKKPVRTVLYDFSKEKDHPLNITSKLEVSLSPDAKPFRKHPIDVRKRLALRQGSVVKQGVKKPRKVSEQTNSSRKTSNRPGRPSSKASSSKPAKRVHRESSSASSQRSEGSSSTSLKASSSKKPAKRIHRESSSSDSSQQSFDEPPRLRGFSPNVSTDDSPDVSPTPSPKKPSYSSKSSSSKLQKPQQKPKRRLIISSDSESSDDERHTRRNMYRESDAPAAKTHEMDVDFEAHSSVEPPSSGIQNKYKNAPAAKSLPKTHEMDLDFEVPSSVEPPSSGSSSGNQSTSGFGGSQSSPEPEPLRDVKVELEKTSPEPLREVRVEPIDEETVYDQSTVVSESMIDNQLAIPRPIEQRTPEKLQNIHQGQHYVGMALTHTTIIDSRLVNCDVQNSTIINCVIQNSSISNSRVTSQII